MGRVYYWFNQAFVFSVLFLTFTALNTAHEEEHETIVPQNLKVERLYMWP